MTRRDRRRRLAVLVLVSATALAGLGGAPSPASAGPPVAAPAVADPAVAGLAAQRAAAQQVASAPYAALFALQIPIYERVMLRPVPDLYPPGEELVMRRLSGPDAGRPGTARFVVVGDRLPEAFSVAEDWGRTGSPVGVITPLDPRTLEPVRTSNYQAITMLTGPIGEVRGIGIGHRYLG